MTDTISVRITQLPHGQGIELPDYQSQLAAGMDLHAAIDDSITIEPGDIVLIPCGFAMALPEGFEAQIRPRSGLAVKHGITVPNAPGTIDADYRGEIKVGLINLSRESFSIERNMRIAQMIIARVCQASWQVVTSLEDTNRGDQGFGHTGL